MQWLSVVSLVLSAVILALHLLHKQDVADKIQKLEDIVAQVAPKS